VREESKPDLSKFVREFVTSGNYDDPAIESSFYAEEVDYFDDGKGVKRGFVVNDIKAYNQRWPKRSYWVVGDPAIKAVDPQGDVARVVVTLKFSFTLRGASQGLALKVVC
jgi:hypothetical protein